MAEYKSFHYLMHQVPENTKPNYVSGPPPLTFPELYSPRDNSKVPVYKADKHFWRSKDRVEFLFFEDRSNKVMFITSKNIETSEAFRTIFVNLEVLYFEVEAKSKGNRDVIKKKKDKKLDGDALYKAAGDFLVARLNIIADPVPWPTFDSNGCIIDNSTPAIATTTVPAMDGASDSTPVADVSPPVSMERMCTLTRLSSDVYSGLEIEKPSRLVIDPAIECVKLTPTVSLVVDTSDTDVLCVPVISVPATDSLVPPGPLEPNKLTSPTSITSNVSNAKVTFTPSTKNTANSKPVAPSPAAALVSSNSNSKINTTKPRPTTLAANSAKLSPNAQSASSLAVSGSNASSISMSAVNAAAAATKANAGPPKGTSNKNLKKIVPSG